MKLFKKLNKGFTLVELVVVIAVIAILSAVSVAAYTGITTNAKKTKLLTEAKALFDEKYSEDLMDGVIDGKNSEGFVAVTSGDPAALADAGEGYHYKAGGESGKKAYYEHSSTEWKVIYYEDGSNSISTVVA